MKSLFFILVSCFLCVNLNASYPAHWWKVVPEDQRKGSWEILPQEAAEGELILSKRNELGQFSNLAHTPFEFEGVHYASVEALWQMMKYPDKTLDKDVRRDFIYEFPYSRNEVKKLHGRPSKKAGSKANKILKRHGVKWISYGSLKFNYKDFSQGSAIHYDLISRAIEQKLVQNPKLIELLLSTGTLVLKPDHKMPLKRPASYDYNEILMKLRTKYSR